MFPSLGNSEVAPTPTMLARSILARHLHQHSVCSVALRAASTATKPKPIPPKTETETAFTEAPTPSSPPPQSWLTRQVKASPTAKKAFLGMATLLGYNSAKQVAARRAHAMYQQLCAVRGDEDKLFWQEGASCAVSLPGVFR